MCRISLRRRHQLISAGGNPIFTASTKLGQGNIFRSVCQEFCSQVGGGWYPSMPCRWYPSMPCRSPGGCIPACLAGFQAHTQGGGELEGSGRGGGSGQGGLQAHTQVGCIPACTEADPHLTATAVGGMHPTGMHSCFKDFSETPHKIKNKNVLQ